jgi:hypothetical protein
LSLDAFKTDEKKTVCDNKNCNCIGSKVRLLEILTKMDIEIIMSRKNTNTKTDINLKIDSAIFLTIKLSAVKIEEQKKMIS